MNRTPRPGVRAARDHDGGGVLAGHAGHRDAPRVLLEGDSEHPREVSLGAAAQYGARPGRHHRDDLALQALDRDRTGLAVSMRA